MCVNPRLMDNGVSVGCHKCWQCRENRINDWVGRCIAEGKTAKASHAVTLTYGPDETGDKHHIRTAVLTYSDVQKWIKLLRFHKHPCRYFAIGEFGAAKGRCHWHVVMFWQDKPPEIVLHERKVQAHWPHGWSYWEPVGSGSVRYNCKYIQKDLRDAERQQQVGMSKKPPLGAAYFADLARRYVKQGLAPQDAFYRFAGERDKHGKPVEFMLRGASLDLFCATYLAIWQSERGGHPPSSVLLTDYLDRQAGYTPGISRRPFRPVRQRPWIVPPEGANIMWSQSHNSWYVLIRGERLFWSFDDRGRRAWQSVIRTEAEAERLSGAFARRQTSDIYRRTSRGE